MYNFNIYVDFQEDFYATVDWAHRIDPLLCISMFGITKKYLSDLKAETAGYVRLLLDAMEDRITNLFTRVSYNYYVKRYQKSISEVFIYVLRQSCDLYFSS